MVISVDAAYKEHALADASAPRVLTEIVMPGGSVYESDLDPEDKRISVIGRISRWKEYLSGPGISYAGSVSVTFDNTDGDLIFGGSGSYAAGLIGRAITIWHFFACDCAESSDAFWSTDHYWSTDAYWGESIGVPFAMFQGTIDSVQFDAPGGTCTIVALDSLRGLLEEEVGEDADFEGTAADVLFHMVDAHSSQTVNTASYEAAQRLTTGTWCKVEYVTTDKVIDILEQVHRAFGTSCWSDAADQIHIDVGAPNFAGFLDIRRTLEVQALHHSGDHDSDDFNIANVVSEQRISGIYNRVTLDYVDINTGESASVTEDDAASQALYGLSELDLSTEALLDDHNARVYPRRLISMYADPALYLRSLTTSLKKGILNQVGDTVLVTDPLQEMDETPFELIRVDKDLGKYTVNMEGIPAPNEKWAYAGSATTGDGSRPSDIMDHLHNKSFEVETNPGVDATPWKWSSLAGAGGTFEVTDDETRDETVGNKSALLSTAGDTQVFHQTIELAPIEAGILNQISFYVKGTISAGAVLIEVYDDTPALKRTITLNANYATWTRIESAIFTNGVAPHDVRIDMNGATADIYFDDMQIDFGFVYPFQENWALFAYAGEDLGEAKPGFDASADDNGAISETLFEGFEKNNVAF